MKWLTFHASFITAITVKYFSLDKAIIFENMSSKRCRKIMSPCNN